MFPSLVWPKTWPQYNFMCLVFPCKILLRSDIQFERYVQSCQTGLQIFESQNQT